MVGRKRVKKPRRMDGILSVRTRLARGSLIKSAVAAV